MGGHRSSAAMFIIRRCPHRGSSWTPPSSRVPIESGCWLQAVSPTPPQSYCSLSATSQSRRKQYRRYTRSSGSSASRNSRHGMWQVCPCSSSKLKLTMRHIPGGSTQRRRPCVPMHRAPCRGACLCTATSRAVDPRTWAGPRSTWFQSAPALHGRCVTSPAGSACS